MTEEKNETKKTPKYAQLFDLPFGVDEYSTGEKRFSRAPAYVIVGVVSGVVAWVMLLFMPVPHPAADEANVQHPPAQTAPAHPPSEKT